MLKITERVATMAAILGGAALLLVSLIVSVEVVLRKLAGVTLGGADEISGYVFAVTTSWALSYTLFHRAHIRIDLVYNYLGATWKAWLDLLSLLSLAFVAGLVAWYGYGVLERTMALASKSNTSLATPLWIPQLFWVAGLVLFIWTLCLLVIVCARKLLASDTRGVSRLAGIPSIDDDVQAALDEAAAATRRS